MPKTILVIDDEPDFLDVMKDLLGSTGYNVLTAEDGRTGVETVNRFMPHLVFLDIAMPGMDGFDVLFELKRNAKTLPVPVVMLTAKSETRSIMKAQEMRASDYVTKPFDGNELIGLIKKYER